MPEVMIHPELLEILCCPETRQPVRQAPAALLESLNRAIRDGSLELPADAPANETLTGGLIREDGKFLYPVRNGIPIMLIEERIPVPPPEAVRTAQASDDDIEDDSHAGHHPVESGAGS